MKWKQNFCRVEMQLEHHFNKTVPNKRKDMKKIIWIIGLLVIVFGVYKFIGKKEMPKEAPPEALKVSAHSEVFNKSISNLLESYYAMINGFVNWDTTNVNQKAVELKAALDNLKTEELKKDSIIYETVLFPLDNSKNNVTSIIQSSNWTEKRRSLQELSENLRLLLITIKYDQTPVYWQECPMAFGEGASGNWLSNAEKVINPYLGKKDPKYGETMLNCGETKETIDFTAKGSSAR